jgi:hypothetical protein
MTDSSPQPRRRSHPAACWAAILQATSDCSDVLSGPAAGWRRPMIRSNCQHSSCAAAGARMRAVSSSPIEISGPGCSATRSRCSSPPGSRARIPVSNCSSTGCSPEGWDRVDRSPNLAECYHMAHRSERANKRTTTRHSRYESATPEPSCVTALEGPTTRRSEPRHGRCSAEVASCRRGHHPCRTVCTGADGSEAVALER